MIFRGLFTNLILKKSRIIKQCSTWLTIAIAISLFIHYVPIEPKTGDIKPVNYNLTKDQNVISFNRNHNNIVVGESAFDRDNKRLSELATRSSQKNQRQVISRDKIRNQSPNENREKGIALCLQRLSGIDCQKINFIIQNESGWVVGIENAEGCKGLSQACPGSKLGEYAGTLEGEVTWTINEALIYNRGQYQGLDGAYQHKLNLGWW